MNMAKGGFSARSQYHCPKTRKWNCRPTKCLILKKPSFRSAHQYYCKAEDCNCTYTPIKGLECFTHEAGWDFKVMIDVNEVELMNK